MKGFHTVIHKRIISAKVKPTGLRLGILILLWIVSGNSGGLFAQVTVSGSNLADGTRANLGAAFTAINGQNQAGRIITITITASFTEPGMAVLNHGLWTSLTIVPSGARIISGSINDALIELNGADNVIIDGLNTGGNSLTISNTRTGTGSRIRTITFTNDATNNSIRNSTIEGSTTSASHGTIVFGTGTTTGNDNNQIINNIIRPAGANLPTNAIFSAGTSVAVDNSNITISNNQIIDYFNVGTASNGILISSNSSAWTISGNRFFQTATRTSTGAVTHRSINIVTASGVDYRITNNIIGFANAAGTGITTYAGTVAHTFRAIEVTVGTADTTFVSGNTIAGISFTTGAGAIALPGFFSGISVLGGRIEIDNNTIGSTTAASSITITSTSAGTGRVFTGIYTTSADPATIQNNRIGGISTGAGATIGYTFHGILTEGTGNHIVRSNLVGSTTMANSISIGLATTTAVCTFNGINNTGTGGITIGQNTVQNIRLFGGGASAFNGILNSGTGVVTIADNQIIAATANGTGASAGIANTAGANPLRITGNTIHTILANAITATSLNGIRVTAGVDNYLLRNTIHNLQANALTSGTLNGVGVSGGTTFELLQNKIYNLSSSSSGITGTGAINGIWVSGAVASKSVLTANNLIGDLRITAASGTNLIRGVAITNSGTTSTINLFHNTIFLSAPTTTGANLGTSGVFHTASTTTTTATLDMRNNIIVNISEFKGTGTTVAFRRSAGTAGMLANYAATSNNNLFFAGTPGPSRLIYTDTVSSAQTITAYRAGVFTAGTIAPRDALSVSENPTWQSTIGSDINYLNINTVIPTQIESGGAIVAAVTTDFAGNIRHGNVGYTGTGFAPDIGAFEFNGIMPDLTWDGGAATSNWNDALNWIFDLLPRPFQTVRLNGANTINVNVTTSIRNLILDHTGLVLTILDNMALTLNNDLFFHNGRLNTQEAFPTIAGQTTITGGTVGYTSTVHTQTVAAHSYHNLTISTPFGASAAGNITVNGVLDLAANPASPPTLGSLNMGSHTLSMGANATTTGIGDVTGRVRRTTFVANTTYTFGSQFTTMSFAPLGTLPSEVIFNIAIGAAPAWSSTAVQRVYDIAQTGGSGTNVNLALRYLDSELNANIETALNIRRHETATGQMVMFGKSSGNYAQNFISRTNIAISNFATSLNQRPWIMADGSLTTISGVRGWRMIASPTQSTYSDWLGNFVTQGFTGATAPTRQPNLIWFDETDPLTTNMSWRTTSNINNSATAGRGYYFFVFGNIPPDPLYTDVLPRIMDTRGSPIFVSGTFSFSGANHPVTFTPNQTNQTGPGRFYDINLADEGWNLLGNPSLQSLNWDATGWTKTNLDNAIYIWDPHISQWRTWNGITGNLGDGLIAPFQAFWVRANAANPVLSFTESVLADGGFFYGGAVKSAMTNEAITVRMGGSFNEVNSEIFISFTHDGRVGPDRLDAYRLEPLNESYLAMFTLSSGSHQMPLVINSLPIGPPDVISLPVYLGGQTNQNPISGLVALTWEIPQNWPSQWSIALHDHQNQTVVDMKANNNYRVAVSGLRSAPITNSEANSIMVLPGAIIHPVSTSSMLKSGTTPPPLSIVINKNASANDLNYIALTPKLYPAYPNPFTHYTYIHFSLPEQMPVCIDVFDIQGRLMETVANQTFDAGHNTIRWSPQQSAARAVYLIRLTSNNSVETTRVLRMNN